MIMRAVGVLYGHLLGAQRALAAAAAARSAAPLVFEKRRSLRDGGCLTCGWLAQDRQFLSFEARRPADDHSFAPTRTMHLSHEGTKAN